MAEKQKSRQKSRAHKMSSGDRVGAKKVTHPVVEDVNVIVKEGRKKVIKSVPVTKNRQGLSELQKILLVGGGQVHFQRRPKRRSVRI